MQDIFDGFGVEVTLDEENFLKVKETLTRIGIASEKTKTLYQSCHILHKRGRYAIVHFKEMFGLDGKRMTMDEDDLARRNTIANLLHDWALVTLVDYKKSELPIASMKQIKVVPFKEKKYWALIAKYQIGQLKNEVNSSRHSA